MLDRMDTQIMKARRVADIAEPPETERAAPGASYYWDRRAQGHNHRQALAAAARDMGQSLRSLAAATAALCRW